MHFNPVTTHVRLMAVLAMAAAALAAGCATARLASGWAPTAVAANGSADDWADKWVCTTMKNGLQLTVANDAARLYVMAKLRANDPQWSRAASRGGLTLRVAGPGKRTMSFRLPQGPERAQGRRPGWTADSAQENGGQSLGAPASDLARYSPRFPAEFEGKLAVTDVDKNVVPVNPDGSQGPAAGFSNDNGMCIYEFSVPLRDTTPGHYSLGAGAGAGLNLTVTAGPDAEMRQAMQETRLQGTPEGGGDFGGGGPRGMGGRGGFGGGPGRGGPQGGPPGGHTETLNPSVQVVVRLAVEP